MQVSKIKILLTTLGITHDDIAEATGVERSVVTRTIRGDRKGKTTQDRITSYIRDQITSNALFGNDPAPPESSPDQVKGGLRSKRKRADLSY